MGVPVERVVERIVEVPVDRIVEVPVERIVETRVEVPVERIVTQTVEVPVERIVETRVEVPTERTVERIVEVPVDRIVEKIVEVPVEKIVHQDRIVEKIVEKRVEVPAAPVVDHLREDALANGRPFVGFGLLERQTTSSGKASTQPLQVESIFKDGPAWDAGLRLGDEVLELGNTPVKTLPQVRDIVLKTKVGQNLRVLARRDGANRELQLAVATSEDKYSSVTDLYCDSKKKEKLTL